MTTEELLAPNAAEFHSQSQELPNHSGAVRAAVKSFPRKLNRIGPRESRYAAASAPCIGERLVRSRLELQLTQAEVAAEVSFQFKSGKRKDVELPLSRNAYCMYELGKVEPSLRTIVGLAHVLKVSPDWLAFGIGKKPTRLRKAPVEADIAGARETRGAEQLETELVDQH